MWLRSGNCEKIAGTLRANDLTAACYNDFRQQRRPLELLSVGRNFRIQERVTFMIRAEFNNAFNRTHIPIPSTTRNETLLRAPDGRYTTGLES